jgi:hypothetical protein
MIFRPYHCAMMESSVPIVHCYDYFPHMRRTLKIAIGLGRFRKGKDAINDGSQRSLGDGAIHRLEHLSRTDEDTPVRFHMVRPQ